MKSIPSCTNLTLSLKIPANKRLRDPAGAFGSWVIVSGRPSSYGFTWLFRQKEDETGTNGLILQVLSVSSLAAPPPGLRGSCKFDSPTNRRRDGQPRMKSIRLIVNTRDLELSEVRESAFDQRIWKKAHLVMIWNICQRYCNFNITRH